MDGPYAFVTLVSSDAYLPGALAQVAALRDLHPRPPVPPELPFESLCLVTPESVDVATVKRLRKAFDHVVGVEILEQDNQAGLALLGRPDLTTVLTKLHVFRLSQYSKIIFLDADVLPIRPLSHLFSLPHEFSAVPDVGWPDIFNSGVLVLTPGEDKFDKLNQLVASNPSWDGGDQGILNEWRGDNWNRLSFTYNTTPTAAYTYAPAYERYGRQIKAIHFIGPNKPWNSIPYRTPGRQTEKDPSDVTQRAYDYDSLVDRWFDVYDRHYNAPTTFPQAPFQVQHYPSVWDQPSEPSQPAPVLGLDDLKRLAIQGLNASSVDTRPGEGTYKSLPLQGRVDLMRPKKEVQEEPKQQAEQQRHEHRIQLPDELNRFPSDSFSFEEVLSTPVARHSAFGDDQPRWHTLPTPGPHEVPSSPRLRKVSLPSTPSYFVPFTTTTPDFYASESEQESLLFVPHDHEQHHNHHHHHHHHEPATHEHHQHVEHQPQHEPQPREEHHKVPQRPISPPMMSWNPAVEPPPNLAPTSNAFPPDTYFANVWDSTPSRANDHRHVGPSPPDSGGFFQAPPPSVIPETLLKQGHYRNVTGESNPGATPSPDRSKIKNVFPWEAQPRAMPGRVFPDSDAPPPSLFLSPGSQSQTSTTTPSTPETRSTPEMKGPARASLLSPLYGLPSALNYANAWDTIPSITKYAERLVKPDPPPAALPLQPAFEDDQYRKNRRKSWDERTEMSSRDGDDEDNADDEDDNEPVAPSSTKWDDDSDGESAKRRSRRGSIVTASELVKSRKKEYRSRGVQTVAVEKRAMAVQVDPPAPPPKQEAPRGAKRSTVSKRHWPASTHPATLPPPLTRGLSVNTLRPSPDPAAGTKAKVKSPSVSPTPRSPVRSARDFIVSPGAATGVPKYPRKVSPPSKPTVRTALSPSTSTSTLMPPFAIQIPQLPAHSGFPPALTAAAATPSATSPGPQQFVSPTSSGLPPPRERQRSRSATATGTLTPSASLSSFGKSPAQARVSPSEPIRRKESNESSLGSPASSIGPLSPADGTALLSPVRKGTRVWDPARGVELFKKGSEEVLAKFLKMGSWEDEAR